ncbi:MAG: phosphomannomutase/phosphoglucomutase [Gammaproteobacteria bacterium]|nr:phosphomannomutase/phosphoglucomutase [Gammaproteobacteria bacterium]MDH5735547.1 phosphomannomutase/phosphoglucomutase [Gammaproteobacteria bacterium]
MSSITASIFKAYDIRGIVKTDLTPDAVRQIGQAFATESLEQNCKTVVIARDGRLSSPELSKALAAGLQAGGCDVIDVGLVPTPVLYFATHYLKTGTGIMITGSHNPPEYNGLKMLIAGNSFFGDSIQQLRQRIEDKKLNAGNGSYREEDVLSAYVDTIIKDVKLAKPMNIAVDCGNGVASVVAVELFSKLGCNITPMYCEVDGNFPNHHPDPSKLENLKDICTKIETDKLDLGLAFDGDGDRVGVIDNNTNVIWPDRQMILYAEDVLSRNPGALIIYDIKSSYHLGHAIKKMGGEPLMWKTGHSFIKTKMKQSGALLAGEMSGHIFFKERWYGFDDGLYSAARMLEILSKKQESAAEIFGKLPDSFNTPELQINFAHEGEHYKFMAAFKQKASFDTADISTIDGMRVNWPNGWGLIRPSNTTPCLVLRFEAENEKTLKEIQEKFRTQLLNMDNQLNLPF